MNTVPEVTILSGERRLQPPPVQCECSARSATASRYANSPCYGKEHQDLRLVVLSSGSWIPDLQPPPSYSPE